MPVSQSSTLRQLIESGRTTPVPGAANALTARIVEDCGFEAVYATGAGIANSYLGVPDIGLLSLPELSGHVAAMRRAVRIPILADADTGFGNAVSVWHTVQVLQSAGADAIQIEDQTFPKRCGHFHGKSVVPASEMVEKIRAAVEARTGSDIVIIARTDARATEGLAAACDRANAYHAAGADMVFVEAPRSATEVGQIAESVSAPKVLNFVEGGVTPQLPHAEVERLGFSIALYANLPLLATIHSTRAVLEHLRDGDPDGRPPVAGWEERQETVGRSWFEEFETRVAAS